MIWRSKIQILEFFNSEKVRTMIWRSKLQIPGFLSREKVGTMISSSKTQILKFLSSEKAWTGVQVTSNFVVFSKNFAGPTNIEWMLLRAKSNNIFINSRIFHFRHVVAKNFWAKQLLKATKLSQNKTISQIWSIYSFKR